MWYGSSRVCGWECSTPSRGGRGGGGGGADDDEPSACGRGPGGRPGHSGLTVCATASDGSRGTPAGSAAKNDYGSPDTWLCRPGRANDACAVDLTSTVVAADGRLTDARGVVGTSASADRLLLSNRTSAASSPERRSSIGCYRSARGNRRGWRVPPHFPARICNALPCHALGSTPRVQTGVRRPAVGMMSCTSTRATPAGIPTCTGMSLCAS